MARVIPAEAQAFLKGALGPDGDIGIRIVDVDPTPEGPRVRFEVPRLRRARGDTHVLPDRDAIAEAVSRYVAVRWRDSAMPRPVPSQSYLGLMELFPDVYDCPTETPDGWHWLLVMTAEWLREAGLPTGFVTTQVKEKFGTLRFYWRSNGDEDQADRITRAAEWLSGAVCDRCGGPGQTRTGGWIRTVCDAHVKRN